jgi:hypothetical protein
LSFRVFEDVVRNLILLSEIYAFLPVIAVGRLICVCACAMEVKNQEILKELSCQGEGSGDSCHLDVWELWLTETKTTLKLK